MSVLKGVSISSNSGGLSDSFETVSKNLKAYPAAFTYTGDQLTSIAYTTDIGTITKTFTYSVGKLTQITLSGNLPSGISTIKTLTYSGDTLTSTSYS